MEIAETQELLKKFNALVSISINDINSEISDSISK